MIIKEGFHWLHANGEWVQYFEVETLAKRLNLDYSIVWKYVQNGMRSDEQLPKQLTGKTTSRKKSKKQEGDFASIDSPVISTVIGNVGNGTRVKSFDIDEYMAMLECEKERYSHDWNDSNLEHFWGLSDDGNE
jgi:hypothetical protein